MRASLASSAAPPFAVALLLVACVSAPSVRPTPARQLVDEPQVGWRLQLPVGARFFPGVREGEAARSPSGTVVKVRLEHFAKPPDEAACWQRLGRAVKLDPAVLARSADDGLPLAGQRAFFTVRPRDASCVVVEVAGPPDAPDLADAAATALETFEVRAPAPEAVPRLAAEAGMQLFDLGEHAAAAVRFEEALVASPDDPQLRLAAGVSHYFAGDTHAAQAATHLDRALDLRDATTSPDRSRGPPLAELSLRNALMYSGLAHAVLKEYGAAESRLGELVVRFPEDATGLYNFACVLALQGRNDEAFAQLDEAVRRDPKLAAHAVNDEDLAGLRGEPAWQRIVGSTP